MTWRLEATLDTLETLPGITVKDSPYNMHIRNTKTRDQCRSLFDMPPLRDKMIILSRQA